MVALPSASPLTQPIHPTQPIDLPQRAPSGRPILPPLFAPDTDPSLPAASYAALPTDDSHAPSQSEPQQPCEEESAAEDTAYSPLLKDHVFSLYCAGQRSPAIAAQLGIPERTARHWIRTTLQQLAQDDVTASPEAARQQRALAIESQRAASASAWDTYHRLTAAHNQLLDLALMATIRQSDTTENAPQPDTAAVTHDPQRLLATAGRLASAAARYLTIIVSANREIAHLQGHAISQDARERQATASREAAAARQLEADLIRAFTTPVLPPEPALPHLSPYASSWPGGITTPQPRPAATPLTAAQATPQSERAAKTAKIPSPVIPIASAQHTSLPTSAAITAIPPATPARMAMPIMSPLPALGATAEAEQPQSTEKGQGKRPETPSKTKIAAKTATPTSLALAKSPQPPRRPANAKRKPQLILPSHQRPAVHPAT